MNLDVKDFYTEVFTYFQYNYYITAALAGVLLLLLFRKPKLFFSLVLIVTINISALYVISNISSLGKAKKKDLVKKDTMTEQLIN